MKNYVVYGHTCEGCKVTLGVKKMTDEDLHLLWEACESVYAGDDQGYIGFDNSIYDIDSYAGISVEEAPRVEPVGDV